MIQNKNYKRQTREVPERVRQLISHKLRGRKKSIEHCKAISGGQKRAWASIRKNEDDNEI